MQSLKTNGKLTRDRGFSGTTTVVGTFTASLCRGKQFNAISHWSAPQMNNTKTP